jgi:peptidoglycan/LPS O-acetylase OafA/YrhL
VATVDNSAVTYGAPLLFGAVVYLFAFARGPVAWLLMTKPANWFGKLSYSIYMVQWIVLIGAGLCMHLLQRLKLIPSDMNVFSTASPLVGDLFVLFYLTTICAIAALTHCLVERPPQRWFERHLQSRGGFAFASAEAAPTPAPTPGVESLNRPIDLSTYETELACRIPPLPHM